MACGDILDPRPEKKERVEDIIRRKEVVSAECVVAAGACGDILLEDDVEVVPVLSIVWANADIIPSPEEMARGEVEIAAILPDDAVWKEVAGERIYFPGIEAVAFKSAVDERAVATSRYASMVRM